MKKIKAKDKIFLLTKAKDKDILKKKAKDKGGERVRIDRAKLAVKLIKKNMTQNELASFSNVSRVTISNIRNGKSCSDETGRKIAKALGVDVTEILETK